MDDMGTFPLNSLSVMRPGSGFTTGCVTDFILINGTGELMHRDYEKSDTGWFQGCSPPAILKPGEFVNLVGDYTEFSGPEVHIRYHIPLVPYEEPGRPLVSSYLDIRWTNLYMKKNTYELEWSVGEYDHDSLIKELIDKDLCPSPVRGFDAQSRHWDMRKAKEGKNSDSFGKSHETNGRTCVAFTVGECIEGPDWVDLWGTQTSAMCDIYEEGWKNMRGNPKWKDGEVGAVLGNIAGWIGNNCYTEESGESDDSLQNDDWTELGKDS
jgi:hypothetical protein